MTVLTEPQPGQFPENTSPENHLRIEPDLFSQPFYRSYLLTGIYLQTLMAHFSDPDNIEDAVVREKIVRNPYRPDQQTGILIQTVSDWRPETEEKRPAVLVNRGGVDVTRRGLGDRHSTDFITGKEEFSVELAGSHVLFAICRTSAEADRLGFEVGRLLLAVKDLLGERLNLSTLQVLSIGEAMQVEESNDHYAAPIVIAYHLVESFALQPHVPVLKRIDFLTQ